MSYPKVIAALAVVGILLLSIGASILLPAQMAYSTTVSQYNGQQQLNQKNIGSGSSDNLNCGTNVSDSTLFEQITCSIEEETPTPGPAIAINPVVTQRSAEVPANPSGTTSAEAQCNPEEVVTGGGFELSEQRRSGGGGGGGTLPPVVFINTSFKEFAENNAWHIEIVNPSLTGTVRVYAECLKLVPA